jgi:hypothetical protein
MSDIKDIPLITIRPVQDGTLPEQGRDKRLLALAGLAFRVGTRDEPLMGSNTLVRLFMDEFLSPVQEWCRSNAAKVTMCYVSAHEKAPTVFVIGSTGGMITRSASRLRTWKWTFITGGWLVASSNFPPVIFICYRLSSMSQLLSESARSDQATRVMPTAEEHRRKAEHNLRFLETVDTDEFGDWMAVAAFYVAVHLVERLRAFIGQHSTDHQDRLSFVRQYHPQMHTAYRELYNIARLVRYGAGPDHWLNPEFVSGCMEIVREYVRSIQPTSAETILSLPTFQSCEERFRANVLNDATVERLRRLITESTVQDEMGILDFSNPNNSGLKAVLL